MKILVIKPSSLGDVVHALPFLKAVKDSLPDAKIDWVISKNLKGLIEDNPLIHEVIIFDKDSWKNIRNLTGTINEISLFKKTLKEKRYDMVVDLQGLLRSGIVTHYTPADTKIGFADAREGSSFFYNRKISVNGTVHAVDKCLEIAKAIGARISKVEFPLKIDETSKDRIKKLIGDVSEYIVVVPSARWVTKRWPVEYFAQLITKLPIPCVITGGKGDREIAQEIIERAQNIEHRTRNADNPSELKTQNSKLKTQILNLAGRTNLKELVALIAGSKVVLSNDSGPMHIAAALDKPIVALFGPTDPVKTGPYGWQKNKNLKVLTSGVSCSPCFRKKCKNFTCMNMINVEKVFNAIKEYI
ncbi:MAG: lipopolysaccharide heptosyltransferase I [Nitrospirae bacterium]|nr:lipopolysaccharide heptosyltransferase I [Nitrospirota bacterium]